MNKKFFNISILIAFIAIVTIGCEKDDSNPLNGKTTAVFNSSISYGTMTDQDGNVYKTVTVGTQTWMAENLRTTMYNDGTIIPNVTDDNEWGYLTTGAYCNYNHTTDTDTIATYGRMYNWFAVNTGKLAPAGWHVSTDSEWKTLITYLGGQDVAAGKLKETGTTHWNSPNTGATNETGFTALPGGGRTRYGLFYSIGDYGYWWSATEGSTSSAYLRGMDSFSSDVLYFEILKEGGFSVRCVRD